MADSIYAGGMGQRLKELHAAHDKWEAENPEEAAKWRHECTEHDRRMRPIWLRALMDRGASLEDAERSLGPAR